MKNEKPDKPATMTEPPQIGKGVMGQPATSPMLSIWADENYRLSRADLRLIARAAGSDWNPSQPVRNALLAKVLAIFKAPRNQREENAALACLLAMEGEDFRNEMLRQRGTTHGIKALSRFPANIFPATRTGRRVHKSR